MNSNLATMQIPEITILALAETEQMVKLSMLISWNPLLQELQVKRGPLQLAQFVRHFRQLPLMAKE